MANVVYKLVNDKQMDLCLFVEQHCDSNGIQNIKLFYFISFPGQVIASVFLPDTKDKNDGLVELLTNMKLEALIGKVRLERLGEIDHVQQFFTVAIWIYNTWL
jgi:hypothetical protein